MTNTNYEFIIQKIQALESEGARCDKLYQHESITRIVQTAAKLLQREVDQKRDGDVSDMLRVYCEKIAEAASIVRKKFEGYIEVGDTVAVPEKYDYKKAILDEIKMPRP